MFRVLIVALVVVAGAGCGRPVRAQMSVAIDAPVAGDATINRDIEVRVAPAENARIVATLTQGDSVDALDTPRGSVWTRIGKKGVPLGFVPKDALDAVPVPPAPTPRPPAPAPAPAAAAATPPVASVDAERKAAMVSKATLDALGEGVVGAMVATRNITVHEKPAGGGTRSKTIRKGQVVGLAAVRGSTLEVVLPGGGAAETTRAGWLGVGAARPDPAPPGPLVIGLLGEYTSYEEGAASVRAFIAGPGASWRDHPPILWPVFRTDRVAWRAGIGPMAPPDLDRACAILTRRGDDCRVIETVAY